MMQYPIALYLVQPTNSLSYQFAILRNELDNQRISYVSLIGYDEMREKMSDGNKMNVFIINSSKIGKQDVSQELLNVERNEVYFYPKVCAGGEMKRLKDVRSVVRMYNGLFGIGIGEIKLRCIKKDLRQFRQSEGSREFYTKVMILQSQVPNKKYEQLLSILEAYKGKIKVIKRQNEISQNRSSKVLVILQKESLQIVSKFVMNNRLEDTVDLGVFGRIKGYNRVNMNLGVVTECAYEILEYLDDCGLYLQKGKERLSRLGQGINKVDDKSDVVSYHGSNIGFVGVQQNREITKIEAKEIVFYEKQANLKYGQDWGTQRQIEEVKDNDSFQMGKLKDDKFMTESKDEDYEALKDKAKTYNLDQQWRSSLINLNESITFEQGNQAVKVPDYGRQSQNQYIQKSTPKWQYNFAHSQNDKLSNQQLSVQKKEVESNLNNVGLKNKSVQSFVPNAINPQNVEQNMVKGIQPRPLPPKPSLIKSKSSLKDSNSIIVKSQKQNEKKNKIQQKYENKRMNLMKNIDEIIQMDSQIHSNANGKILTLQGSSFVTNNLKDSKGVTSLVSSRSPVNKSVQKIKVQMKRAKYQQKYASRNFQNKKVLNQKNQIVGNQPLIVQKYQNQGQNTFTANNRLGDKQFNRQAIHQSSLVSDPINTSENEFLTSIPSYAPNYKPQMNQLLFKNEITTQRKEIGSVKLEQSEARLSKDTQPSSKYQSYHRDQTKTDINTINNPTLNNNKNFDKSIPIQATPYKQNFNLQDYDEHVDERGNRYYLQKKGNAQISRSSTKKIGSSKYFDQLEQTSEINNLPLNYLNKGKNKQSQYQPTQIYMPTKNYGDHQYQYQKEISLRMSDELSRPDEFGLKTGGKYFDSPFRRQHSITGNIERSELSQRQQNIGYESLREQHEQRYKPKIFIQHPHKGIDKIIQSCFPGIYSMQYFMSSNEINSEDRNNFILLHRQADNVGCVFDRDMGTLIMLGGVKGDRMPSGAVCIGTIEDLVDKIL